jgi:hypothetical protein
MYQNCTKTPVNRGYWRLVNAHFIGSAVDLLKGFTFHRQLHLRVFFEHVGVPLSQQLNNPFIRYTSGTKTRCVGRAEVVNPEIRNSRLVECCPPNSLGGFVALALRSVTGKKPVTRSGKRELVSKRIHGDGVSGTSAWTEVPC